MINLILSQTFFIFIISTLKTLLQSSYFGSLIFKYLKTPKKFLIKSGEKWIYCYSENKYRSCYSILVGITLVSIHIVNLILIFSTPTHYVTHVFMFIIYLVLVISIHVQYVFQYISFHCHVFFILNLIFKANRQFLFCFVLFFKCRNITSLFEDSL